MDFETLFFILVIVFAGLFLFSYYKKGYISWRLILLIITTPIRVVLALFINLDKVRAEFKKGYTKIDKEGSQLQEKEVTSFERGEMFEEFIEDNIFPEAGFDLLHKTPSYATNKKRYVASSQYPDFKFRDRRTNREFWVEVKFRKGFYKGRIDWCNDPEQLSRYKSASIELPLFLALGIGGEPNDPRYISIIPLRGKYIKFRHLYVNEIEQFTINTKIPITSELLWRLT